LEVEIGGEAYPKEVREHQKASRRVGTPEGHMGDQYYARCKDFTSGGNSPFHLGYREQQNELAPKDDTVRLKLAIIEVKSKI
jgi:hypothetical protein